MARMQALAFFTLATLAAAPAIAADTKAVLGGAIGGGTGAAVGSAVGGTNGAIIGGALGGAAGAAIATSGSRETKVVTKEVIVEREVVHSRHPSENGLRRGHHKNRH